MTFAKLFDTPDGQLLVTQEYDEDEEGRYRICLRGEQYKDVDPAVTYGWHTEQERDAAFDSTDQAKADQTAGLLARTARNMLD